MTGINFAELYDFIEHNHEIEFTYRQEEYTIEPAGDRDSVIFDIWKYGEKSARICRVSKDADSEIRFTIDRLLNQKCFYGKSFMEIEQEVTVDTIF